MNSNLNHPDLKKNGLQRCLTLQSVCLIQIDPRHHRLVFRHVANDQATFTRDSEMLLAGSHVVRFLFRGKTLLMNKSTIVTNSEVLQSTIIRIGNENTRRGLVEQRSDTPRRIELVGIAAAFTAAFRTKHQLRSEQEKKTSILLADDE
jgi:hypothetical protein